MAILVTGGAGYIGSHTAIELLGAGHEVVVCDNLSNSHANSVKAIERIAGRRPEFVKADILDRAALDRIFGEYRIDSVIHFAGLKAVGESVAEPVRYYRNNVTGSVNLFGAMADHGVKRLVFSSSATVYGDPHAVPIREDFPLKVTNPYGRTKLIIEDVLRDIHRADESWRIAILRYFNPVGAHESGLTGEDPLGIPNNLMPFVSKVAVGQLPHLSVFGNDYPTRDGTGVRDYIHVTDLANGHLKALDKLDSGDGLNVWNLGTGAGCSVLELVAAFEEASGAKVPYVFVARRPGDVAECYADPARAAAELGWRAERGINDMCEDAWRWQKKNPKGHRGAGE